MVLWLPTDGEDADDDAVGHGFATILWYTSFQGDPAPGSLWYASNRSSMTRLSSSVRTIASRSTAIVSQMSSTSCILSGIDKVSVSVAVMGFIVYASSGYGMPFGTYSISSHKTGSCTISPEVSSVTTNHKLGSCNHPFPITLVPSFRITSVVSAGPAHTRWSLPQGHAAPVFPA